MNNELWKFETDKFKVVCTAEPEYDLDLSWDEDGHAARSIESGEFDAFCAVITVYHLGMEIASNCLGDCIYRPDEFTSGHRNPDPAHRNCSLMRAARGDNACIGHYFPSMVREAIGEARSRLQDLKETKTRANA